MSVLTEQLPADRGGGDSDNPTATWDGLIGSALGHDGVVAQLGGEELSDAYWVHRTRRGFSDRTADQPDKDTFAQIAGPGVGVVDRVVVERLTARGS